MKNYKAQMQGKKLLNKYECLGKEQQQLVDLFINEVGSSRKEKEVSFFTFIGWDGQKHFDDLIMYRANIYFKAKKNGLL